MTGLLYQQNRQELKHLLCILAMIVTISKAHEKICCCDKMPCLIFCPLWQIMAKYHLRSVKMK